MKQEKVIDLAKQAECYESHSSPSNWDDGDWIASLDQLTLFASLVEQETLERAARKCIELANEMIQDDHHEGCVDCENAIRNLAKDTQ
jgi:hypothetical protein